MVTAEREKILGAFSAGDVPVLFVSPEMALAGALQAIQEAVAEGLVASPADISSRS